MRYYLGIDPGASGGMAVLDESGGVVEVSKMPDTILGILAAIEKWKDEDVVCVLEDVGRGMPGQSSKATATFARHNGHLEMALLASRIRTYKVTPQKWEKTYQLGKSGGMDKAAWKRKLKEKAQQLFPSLGKKITLATCDALLIAEYGRTQKL